MSIAQRKLLATMATLLRTHANTFLEVASLLEQDGSDEGDSKYIDQYSSPLSKRVYLAHARRGEFPTKRVGKRVLAERELFARWLDEHANSRPAPSPPKGGPRSVDDAVLAELGARTAGQR